MLGPCSIIDQSKIPYDALPCLRGQQLDPSIDEQELGACIQNPRPCVEIPGIEASHLCRARLHVNIGQEKYPWHGLQVAEIACRL